jgi:hypothetical protein
MRVRGLLLGGGLILGILAPTLGCGATAHVSARCLARASVLEVAGRQSEPFPTGGFLADETAIDAATAEWRVPETATGADYPVYFRGNDGDGLCLVGGFVYQPYDHDTTPWEVWHDSAGVLVKTPDFTAVKTRLRNVGDGFRVASNSTTWHLQGVHVSRAHDDCVENDWLHSGTIDDAFFDGCYAFYSSRAPQTSSSDSSDDRVVITNSLVRMEAMPFDDDGGPGHGPIWKLGNGLYTGGPARTGISPRLEVRNVMIRVSQRPSQGGSLGLPSYDHDGDAGTQAVPYFDPADCSDNVLILSGPVTLTAAEQASYDAAGCFTILRGAAGSDAWNAAVAAWNEAR